MNNTKNVTAWRAVLCAVLAVAVLVISQLAAFLLGSVPVVMGLPQAVGNILSAVLYPLFALLALKLLCGKLLGVTLADCRITRYKIKPVWAAAAFIMPVMAVGGLLMFGGHWENPRLDGGQVAALVTQSVFLVGLAVGSVEEAVFRGVMMKALEMRWGKGAAAVVPSALFAVAHVLNGGLSVTSFFGFCWRAALSGYCFRW